MAATTQVDLEGEHAIVFGPKDIPLLESTLGALIDEQAARYGEQTATVFSWQKHRASYRQLADRSKSLAKSMLEMGLKHGDCVGIQAGNCYQYIEVFLGAARIGCPVVVLNNTYTPDELVNATSRSACVLLILAATIGPKDQSAHIQCVCSSVEQKPVLPQLKRLVVLAEAALSLQGPGPEVVSYNAFVRSGLSVFMNDVTLRRAEARVQSSDVLNLQFTSGTTGAPKAAMLTHRNLLNNGLLVGSRMRFEPGDVVCCPPPLFHCFGLAMGFLGCFTTGSTIVFPCDSFDANEVLDTLFHEKCTTLYGVPTMFVAALEASKIKKYEFVALKKGLAAGAPVPMVLLKQMEKDLGIATTLNAYGMTETSPVTCMTAFEDGFGQRLKTVGRVLPHTGAKIIDRNGHIVRRGIRGEICTSGYALQKGYWKNEAGTREAVKTDENDVRWMHTGDEGVIDAEGFISITGRIKDLIIRGGENIFPLEIEERLLAHPSVVETSVVGLPDEKYGEVVACFIRQREGSARPSLDDVAEWVRQTLGRHKAPRHVFWIGDADTGADFPKTGSGKHQKHILRALGKRLLEQKDLLKAKL